MYFSLDELYIDLRRSLLQLSLIDNLNFYMVFGGFILKLVQVLSHPLHSHTHYEYNAHKMGYSLGSKNSLRLIPTTLRTNNSVAFLQHFPNCQQIVNIKSCILS